MATTKRVPTQQDEVRSVGRRLRYYAEFDVQAALQGAVVVRLERVGDDYVEVRTRMLSIPADLETLYQAS